MGSDVLTPQRGANERRRRVYYRSQTLESVFGLYRVDDPWMRGKAAQWAIVDIKRRYLAQCASQFLHLGFGERSPKWLTQTDVSLTVVGRPRIILVSQGVYRPYGAVRREDVNAPYRYSSIHSSHPSVSVAYSIIRRQFPVVKTLVLSVASVA